LQEPKKVWRRVRQSATIKIWLNDKNLKPIIESSKNELTEGYSEEHLYSTIKSKAKKQGISLPMGVMDLWLHDLRHSLGSWMAHSGASQYIIGKSLNHKSPKSTEVYARFSIDHVRESMSQAVRLMHGESQLRSK
jgi:integrase